MNSFRCNTINSDVLFMFFLQLCDSINKLEGLSTEPYSCTTTDGSVGYLHRVALQVHDSTSHTQQPIHLATIEYWGVTLALVTCTLTKTTDTESTTLVPQLVKSVMDLSSTERIICLMNLNQTNHSQCKLNLLCYSCCSIFVLSTFFSDVEEFQNLGYRPVVAKGESTSYLQRKSEATNEIHSNVLVSRYAQKGLTGN